MIQFLKCGLLYYEQLLDDVKTNNHDIGMKGSVLPFFCATTHTNILARFGIMLLLHFVYRNMHKESKIALVEQYVHYKLMVVRFFSTRGYKKCFCWTEPSRNTYYIQLLFLSASHKAVFSVYLWTMPKLNFQLKKLYNSLH